jgi:phosphatidylglycerol lysyltransferase
LTNASWRITALRVVKFVAVGGLIAAFAWSAGHELRQIEWSEVRVAFAAIDRDRITFAAACLVLNYALLTLYDLLAFRVLGVKLTWSAVAPRAAAAFAFSNFVGLGFVSGAAVRLRLDRDLVPQPAMLAKVIALNGISLWGGLFMIVGLALFQCAEPMSLPGKLTDVRNFAPLLVGAPLAWVVFTAISWVLPARIRDLLPPLKPLHILGLLLLAAADWITLAAIYLALLGDIPKGSLIVGATGFWLCSRCSP